MSRLLTGKVGSQPGRLSWAFTWVFLAWLVVNPAAWAEARATLRGHTNIVWSVAFSPDGKLLASGGNDRTIRLWDAATGSPRGVLEGHADSLRSVAFSPDGKLLASGDWGHQVKLWDLKTGRDLHTFQVPAEGGLPVAFSPDGKLLAAGTGDGTVKLWEVATRQERATLEGHESQVFDVAFSPDGQTLATASQDRTIILWNVATGRERFDIRVKSYAVLAIAFSPIGKDLATAGGGGDPDGGYLSLYDSETGREIGTLKAHDHAVFGVTFSPNGQSLATAGHADMSAKILDVDKGKELATFTGHTLAVMDVAFSPDGQTLATASADKTVKLWDVTGAKPDPVAAQAPAPEAEPDPNPALPSIADPAPPAETPAPVATDRTDPPSAPLIDDQEGEVPPPPEPIPAPPARELVAQVNNLLPPPSPPNEVSDPAADPARNQIIHWIKVNNRFGPDAQIVQDMTEQIDATVREGRNYSLGFGGGLTRSGKFFLVHSWASQMFVFELTEDQAQRLKLERMSVSYHEGAKIRDRRERSPSALISTPTFSRGNRLQGSQRIKGQVNCKVLKPSDTKYALRLGYSTDATSQSFSYPDGLPKQMGPVSFDFGPVNSEDEKEKFSGPLAVFMDLCSVQEKNGEVEIVIYSNTVGQLVEITAD